jgi:hypothetical protein
MAFTLPAMAVDDIEDNQAGVALLGQTNQAQKGGEIDNDGLDLDTGDIASGNSLDNDTTDVDVTTGDLLSGNTDDHSNNSTNTSDTDGTDVDVTTGDLLSNNTDNSINDNDGTDVDVAATDVLNDKSDDDVLDNKNGTIEVSDIANDKSVNDNDGTDVDVAVDDINVSDVANDKHSEDNDLLDNKDGSIDVSDIANDKSSHDNETVDMNDNMAAASMGGFAIGVSIDDIELNLASTTSVTGISQSSDYDANALGLGFVGSEFKSEDHCVKGKVFDNVGLTGANFTAGHFNNNANLNNVTMTVQY